MRARKKNMERMAEVVPESDEQALQHFSSNFNRDARSISDQVARKADALFLPRRDVGVDEVIRQLGIRHRKRQVSIGSAYVKQQLE